MKIKMLSFTIIVFISGIISIGCGTTTTKNSKLATINTKEAKEHVNQVRKESQEELNARAKVDWETFNEESQTAIKERELQIETLRLKISKINKEEAQKFTSALDTLEDKKNSLKERLAQINKNIKANMKDLNASDEVIKRAFERAFVQDMNELIAGIRNFWKNK